MTCVLDMSGPFLSSFVVPDCDEGLISPFGSYEEFPIGLSVTSSNPIPDIKFSTEFTVSYHNNDATVKQCNGVTLPALTHKQQYSAPGPVKMEHSRSSFQPYDITRQSSPSLSYEEDGDCENDRLLRRRKKNREAAQKSRLRKRMKVEGLEMQLAEHMAVHRDVLAAKATVEQENELLREEIASLKRILGGAPSHVSSPSLIRC